MPVNDLRRKLRDVPWTAFVLYAALLFGALLAFGELAGEVYEQELIAFDGPVLTWLDGVRTPLITGVARTLSFLGSVFVLAPAGVVIFTLLWRRSRRRSAVFFVLAVGGAAVLNLAAKAFFARARPDLFAALSPVFDTSFPSGHTMGSAAFFLSLFVITRRLAPRWQGWVGGVGLVMALGIGLSRPYLQVHFPSDVLAGWSLSLAWVMGVRIWYVTGRGGARREEEHLDDAPWDDAPPRDASSRG